jgi:hypothetical protein
MSCPAGGQYQLKCNATEFQKPRSECAQLDTNGDGVINMADDPYTPYYPGESVRRGFRVCKIPEIVFNMQGLGLMLLGLGPESLFF